MEITLGCILYFVLCDQFELRLSTMDCSCNLSDNSCLVGYMITVDI